MKSSLQQSDVDRQKLSATLVALLQQAGHPLDTEQLFHALCRTDVVYASYFGFYFETARHLAWLGTVVRTHLEDTSLWSLP